MPGYRIPREIKLLKFSVTFYPKTPQRGANKYCHAKLA